MKKQVDSWEKDFKNEASYALRLDDMIEGLRKESLRKNEEKECRFRPNDENPREVECWECGAKGHTKN
nr:hypothetical protein [Tanacetum cinerariifolium]